MRPRDQVRMAHPNDYKTIRASFEVIGIDYDRSIDGETAACVTFTSADIPDCMLYCRTTNVKLVKPGPPNMYFIKAVEPPPPPAGTPLPPPPSETFAGSAEVFISPQQEPQPAPFDNSDPESDCDDEEEVPAPHSEPGDLHWDEFTDNIDFDTRAADGLSKFQAKLKGVTWESFKHMDAFTLFKKLFPVKYVINHVLPATNRHLELFPWGYGRF